MENQHSWRSRDNSMVKHMPLLFLMYFFLKFFKLVESAIFLWTLRVIPSFRFIHLVLHFGQKIPTLHDIWLNSGYSFFFLGFILSISSKVSGFCNTLQHQKTILYGFENLFLSHWRWLSLSLHLRTWMITWHVPLRISSMSYVTSFALYR